VSMWGAQMRGGSAGKILSVVVHVEGRTILLYVFLLCHLQVNELCLWQPAYTLLVSIQDLVYVSECTVVVYKRDIVTFQRF
jgi:hypothetical protein